MYMGEVLMSQGVLLCLLQGLRAPRLCHRAKDWASEHSNGLRQCRNGVMVRAFSGCLEGVLSGIHLRCQQMFSIYLPPPSSKTFSTVSALVDGCCLSHHVEPSQIIFILQRTQQGRTPIQNIKQADQQANHR